MFVRTTRRYYYIKKTKLLLTSLALSASVLAGCGAKVEAGHFGFGGIATYKVTAPAAATDTAEAKVGAVQTDITYASILLGKDSKIKQLRLDVVQIKVAANDAGDETVYTSGADPLSKWEKLGDYNMVGASPIGKEWYEQAEAFENFAVGKTVSELVALEDEDTNLVGGVDAGVTIHVNAFMDAIVNADAVKVALDDVTDLKIGVGGVGTTGNNQSNYTIAAAAFDADKKVEAARMDVYQIPYVLTAATDTLKGAIALNEAKVQVVSEELRIKSKHELGDDYGMRDSATKGEWFEQANKITDYMVGKTIAEALEIDAESNHLVNEVAADVTIKAVDYRGAFDEAVDTAFNARYTA